MQDFSRRLVRLAKSLPSISRGFWRGISVNDTLLLRSETIRSSEHQPPHSTESTYLENYFDNHRTGRGIWKWRHYFPIYEKHLSKFRDRNVRALEIGVYSGGSLQMWKEYFGGQSMIYGVDIEAGCQVYAEKGVDILIGDQGDRQFWKKFREEHELLDVVIDDGGHHPEQQLVTLEELLPYMAPGGVYICEDITGRFHAFSSAIFGLACSLNASERMTSNSVDFEKRLLLPTNGAQSSIKSISFYPLIVVIEMNDTPIDTLTAPKHGSIWEPHLS